MGVQLVNVQRIAALVHVGVVSLARVLKVAINLDGLSAVALLGVKLASIHAVANINGFNEESLAFIAVIMVSTVVRVGVSRNTSALLAYQRLTRRIETEIGLGH